ncbi:PDxFFG protein [Mycoplasma tullyi]|uniref:PDxFFG protein n=1 Tax=Mycoplasma tullyi TaxID=1612150 RepID=A0A7D7U2Y8_9MOLU|nr:PDxFFG protein [Mycoplasma tullyi]QMT98371.1 PDxFFG protein [Mycoplasma tullyi]
MIKKWSLKSKSLWLKTGIALGVIGLTAGVIIGAMVGFAENSSEKNGQLSPANKQLFNNDYSKIYDQNGQLKPELTITNGNKTNVTAKISDDATEFSFLDNSNKKYNFDEFFSEYYKRFNEPFVLEIKYGSFSFFDEYVLAVRPKQFLEFTNWFITNVAWGPDLLTLDSFRLVPGVEQNGNAITLGSHSTLHKEVSEIKFFPDAFFGSLPIYSTIGGPGNAVDSLTYSVFSNESSKKDLDAFLKNIPLESALKNDIRRESAARQSTTGFGEIYRASKLVDKTFKIRLGNPARKQNANDPTVYERSLIVNENFSQADLDTLKTQYPDLANVAFDQFKTYQIKSVNVTQPGRDNVEPVLNLVVAEPDSQDTTFNLQIDPNSLNETRYISYKTLVSAYQDNISSFLNFYDMDSYLNNEFYLYQDDNNQNHFYKLFLEAINENPDLKALNTLEEQKAKVKKYKVLSFEKTSNPQANEHTLKVNLQEVSENSQDAEEAQEGPTTSLEFVANRANDYSPQGFDDFLEAINYQGGIDPVSLFYTPSDNNARDEQGNPLTGLASRNYQLYVSVYNNLIKKVVNKYPHLLRNLDGPHVERTVDANGVFEYNVVEGKFKGFTPSDRIGLPTILAALEPGFDGLPIDFLKYVAAHEYGHHYTLDQGQAFIDKDNPVIVGGLSTRAGASDASFYSYRALINYLDARSNLEAIRVNANNQETPTGKFIRFRFGIIDENGNVLRYETEPYQDIWGTENPNDPLSKVLENKKRRFLQDFSGLTEAAKLRKVALRDLFFANSFDSDSGTINPSISGLAKAFVKSQAEGETSSEYKWAPVTAASIISQLTDGAGNPLLNKSVFVLENDRLSFKIYETEPNKPNVITAINMFNKDGSPVINVPLNVELSPAEMAYVERQAKVISDSISATIEKNLSDNGWDSRGTVLGGEISGSIGTPGGSDGVSELVEKIRTRSNPEESRSSTNEFNTARKGFSYLVLQNGLALQWRILRTNLASLTRIDQQQQAGARQGNKDRYVRSDVNKILAVRKAERTINSIGTALNNFDTYVFPYVRGNKFLGEIANDTQNGLIDRLNNVSSSNQLRTTEGLFNVSFTEAFTNVLFQGQAGLLSYAMKKGGAGDAATNNYSLETIQAFDRKVNDVFSKPLMVSIPTLLTTSLEKIDKDNILIVNPFGSDVGQLEQALLNAVTTSKKISVDNGTTTPQATARSTYNSKNLTELLGFVSLDYSKATYDSATKQYNWDVSYVQSKFDLSAIGNIQVTNSPDAAKLKAAITAAGTDTNAKNQALANYAIYLFRHSNLFMSVKDFSPATDLVKNRAVFSELYGVTMLDKNFTRFYVEELTPQLNDGTHFDAQRLQNYFDKFVKDNKLESVQDRLSFHDLLLLTGNIVYYGKNGDVGLTLGSFNFGYFSPGLSSDDVVNYNATRVEPQLADKFTDYVYNIAETLTRDYVQTTYAPNTKDFENVPKYLGGLSEAMSGLDYIVDATNISKVNDTRTSQDDLAKALQAVYLGPKYTAYYDELIKVQGDLTNKFNETVDEFLTARREVARVRQASPNDVNALATAIAAQTIATQKLNDAQKAINDLKAQTRAMFFKNNDGSFYQTGETRRSSYFGQFISKNNGYFKDHFEKQTIGAELYDDDRNPVIDNNIRTVDFNGNKVNKRPEAFFLSQLYNYGVSKRTVSGLFRNQALDALALYGYVPTELANKIGYLRFTNVFNNEVVYLKVNTKRTNNIFWLQKQGDPTSKKTIEDYGYTSWLSDYALMGKYRDALLRPGQKYTVDFVDENHNFLQAVDLGDAQFISENAKAVEQSPVKIENENTTVDGNKNIKTVISVDFQFNVTN